MILQKIGFRYVILVAVVILGAAVWLLSSGKFSIARSCSSDASRPCFELATMDNQQARINVDKTDKLDKDKGEKEFSACVKKESNHQVEGRERTKICETEVIKYCEGAWGDDKNSTKNENKQIKKYDGRCEPKPTTTPPPPTTAPTSTPSRTLSSPTVSIISPTSGRGWAPNTDIYIKVNVSNYLDPVKYGELTFNLVRAGSVVQTFPFKAAPSSSGVPQNGQANGVWTVPPSFPAGSDYTLEAYFANFPNAKTVSAPFSILGNSVTVNVHAVDALTGAPVQASLSYNLNGIYMHPSTDAMGNFSLTEPTIQFWETNVGMYAACHLGGFGFSSWLDYSAYGYEQPNNFIGDDAFGILQDQGPIVPRLLYVPTIGPSNDITVRMWPGVDIAITSDIPVAFSINYGSIGGAGNSNYSTTQGLGGGVIPIDMDTTVTLTDQSGTTYVSPILHLPRTYSCVPVKLVFAGGQFTWQY